MERDPWNTGPYLPETKPDLSRWLFKNKSPFFSWDMAGLVPEQRKNTNSFTIPIDQSKMQSSLGMGRCSRIFLSIHRNLGNEGRNESLAHDWTVQCYQKVLKNKEIRFCFLAGPTRREWGNEAIPWLWWGCIPSFPTSRASQFLQDKSLN